MSCKLKIFFGILLTASSLVAQPITLKLRANPEVKQSTTKETSENINDQKSVVFGISVPMDNGRGYPTVFGYFLWKRKAWPWPSSDFKLTFAGIAADAELTLRSLLSEETDLGFGMNYRVLKRFEEYRQGQIDIGNRMEVNQVAGRLFVQQHLMANYAEIGQLRGTYEWGYTDYSRDDDTSSNFTLAPDGLFQTLKLNGGSGKLKSSNYSPSGWDFNFGAEATFRDHWRRWGPPNLWDSPSEFQKFQLNSTYVASSFGEQKIISKLSGGVGNDLDRLSAFKLGGSLTGLPEAFVLHGFYTREIFAEDFVLLNLDYLIPILKEQQLALHFYLDGAATRRGDIPDRDFHDWVGSGAGMSFKGWWETDWLIGYGYGINAQRGADLGGHEIFTQMSKKF